MVSVRSEFPYVSGCSRKRTSVIAIHLLGRFSVDADGEAVGVAPQPPARPALSSRRTQYPRCKPTLATDAMTGTAIWEVREDGKLTRNTVEQASFELYHSLLEK